MSEFEKEQCRIIALYYPIPYADVVRIFFILCNKSFDETVKYIEKKRLFYM